MKARNILHHCRYYHGESKPPQDERKAQFWGYEARWVQLLTSKDNDVLNDMLEDYNLAGLAHFEMQDDTPLTLKALLFNRFCHWRSASMLDCVEDFKKFYKNEYL